MKVAFLASVALATLPLASESIRFSVAVDDVLSSEWDIESVRSVQTAELILMGDSQDVGSDSTATLVTHMEFVDSFTKVTGNGAPLAISRAFETLGTDKAREGLSEDVTSLENGGESLLMGATVDFTFDSEAETWSAAFSDDSSGEDEWLDDLAPRIDLASVLPEEEVEVGDSWDVPASLLADVLRPGGEVIVLNEPDAGNLPEGGVQITLPSSGSIDRLDEFEGELTATLEEVLEEEGQRLAKIVFEVDVSADLDIVEELEAEADERGSEEDYTDGTLNRTLEGQLTVLWNLKTNRPVSISGELSGTSELRVEWSMGAGDSGDFTLELGFVEDSEVTHSIEATFGD
ncbi:hypothetical protein Poly30_08040 [Planctomycetes bacterium Poly30]|uniref:Uncharacterized protein n=1 Tax=Saltatorellus ferox TaxID=2528018 RepID=A0A518EMJ7_9BACT|nr:hypothetical protein Poly30_08040 [Planctomycetes bacterium Poly30]